MSTTFAIFNKIPVVDPDTNEPVGDYDEDDYTVIARRDSGGISFVIPYYLVLTMIESTPVFPIDNTAQGIYTVGDLKAEYLLYKDK